MKNGFHVGVIVKDKDDFDRALRKFKKKVNESGHLEELRERQEFIKPSVKKRKQKKVAIREQQKQNILDRIFDGEDVKFYTKKRKKRKK